MFNNCSGLKCIFFKCWNETFCWNFNFTFFCSPLLFQESAIGRAFPIFVAGKQPFTYIDPIIKCTNSNNTMKCKKCMIVKASFINVKDIFNLFTYQIRRLALINHSPHSHYAGPCILVQRYFEVITFLSFGGWPKWLFNHLNPSCNSWQLPYIGDKAGIVLNWAPAIFFSFFQIIFSTLVPSQFSRHI